MKKIQKNKAKLLLAWSAVIICMIAIFMLSNQPASISNATSKEVVRQGVEATVRIVKAEITETKKWEIINGINSVGREYMHGVVFLLLGVFMYIAVKTSGTAKVRASEAAAADEIETIQISDAEVVSKSADAGINNDEASDAGVRVEDESVISCAVGTDIVAVEAGNNVGVVGVVGAAVVAADSGESRAMKLRAFVISVVICLAYALFDEAHQLFIPGRAFQISDLVMDSIGSILGIGISILSVFLYMRRIAGLRLKHHLKVTN